MPNSVAQRLGPFSRLVSYLEGTRGSDSGITAGLVQPIRDASRFQVQRGEVKAPFFNGTLGPFSTAPGPVMAAGPLPLGLEFTTAGHFLKGPFGTAGYNRIPLVTGSRHDYFIPSGVFVPLTYQLQAEYLEGTAQYERARYAMVKSLAFAYANGGAAPFDVEFVGTGDVVQTDLAGTKTDNGYSGVSVYNGQARLAVAAAFPTWFTLSGVSNFNVKVDTQAVREDVAFNDGVAGSINPSNFDVSGMLELLMATDGANPENNFNYLNYAINRTLMMYDCTWADATVGAAPYPSKWLYLQIASTRLTRMSETPGGKLGNRTGQRFDMVPDTTLGKCAAFNYCTVVGPWTFTAGNNIFTVKIDGGSNLAITLTTGSRSAAQVCTDLNANGPFTAVAFADVYNGRVRVTSKQISLAGASSSVQFVTGQANGSETLMGWIGTSIAGYNSPIMFSAYNLQNANY